MAVTASKDIQMGDKNVACSREKVGLRVKGARQSLDSTTSYLGLSFIHPVVHSMSHPTQTQHLLTESMGPKGAGDTDSVLPWQGRQIPLSDGST